jgi:hypothetical protein
MAVVVNEMEVTPAAPEGSSSATGCGGKSNGKPMDPREVERAVMKQTERRIRVRAH